MPLVFTHPLNKIMSVHQQPWESAKSVTVSGYVFNEETDLVSAGGGEQSRESVEQRPQVDVVFSRG